MKVVVEDLSKKVAARMNVTKAEAERMVKAVFSAMSDEISEGNDIVMRNEFTLKCIERAPRKGRNFHTEESISLPAQMIVKFQPSNRLYKAMQKS